MVAMVLDIWHVLMSKDYKLSDVEFTCINEKYIIIQQLEQIRKATESEIGSLIELICKQNKLEGTWGLDINKGILVKKEDDTKITEK